jgi:hypothetical protein
MMPAVASRTPTIDTGVPWRSEPPRRQITARPPPINTNAIAACDDRPNAVSTPIAARNVTITAAVNFPLV